MATPKVTPFPAGKQAPGLRHRVSRMTHLTPDELLSVLKAARDLRPWSARDIERVRKQLPKIKGGRRRRKKK